MRPLAAFHRRSQPQRVCSRHVQRRARRIQHELAHLRQIDARHVLHFLRAVAVVAVVARPAVDLIGHAVQRAAGAVHAAAHRRHVADIQFNVIACKRAAQLSLRLGILRHRMRRLVCRIDNDCHLRQMRPLAAFHRRSQPQRVCSRHVQRRARRIQHELAHLRQIDARHVLHFLRAVAVVAVVARPAVDLIGHAVQRVAGAAHAAADSRYVPHGQLYALLIESARELNGFRLGRDGLFRLHRLHQPEIEGLAAPVAVVRGCAGRGGDLVRHAVRKRPIPVQHIRQIDPIVRHLLIDDDRLVIVNIANRIEIIGRAAHRPPHKGLYFVHRHGHHFDLLLLAVVIHPDPLGFPKVLALPAVVPLRINDRPLQRVADRRRPQRSHHGNDQHPGYPCALPHTDVLLSFRSR